MVRPPKQGLAEYVVVFAVLSALVAAAVLAFREPIRSFFGEPPARAARTGRAASPPR